MSLAGDIAKAVAPALVTFGTGLVMNNQEKKRAKGEANRIKEENEKIYQAELLRQQNLKLLKEVGKEPEKEKSKLPLYIGLGVGGIVVIGVVIFAVTRK